MEIYMHYWEISIIFFCPGNLGKDLRTTIKKKKTLSEEKVPFDFFKSTLHYLLFYILTVLKMISKNLKKPTCE